MLTELITAFATGSTNDLKEALASLLLSLPIIILALSVHETAHGYVAKKLGDPTASSLGRLSLNPLKHIDPIGFICMILFHFGWAKPVPINTRYFKNPRRDMFICAIAGPLSNIALALIFGVLLKTFYVIVPLLEITYTSSLLVTNIINFSEILLFLGIYLNVTLAVFNLLPIPPLDGSRVLYLFMPQKWLFKLSQYERYIHFAFLGLLFLGILDKPLDFLIDNVLGLIWFILRLPQFPHYL